MRTGAADPSCSGLSGSGRGVWIFRGEASSRTAVAPRLTRPTDGGLEAATCPGIERTDIPGLAPFRATVTAMSPAAFALLVLVGFAAGLASSMVGLASLISYPALLAFGLSPVAANVTNTVALSINGVGAIAGSRPELSGQGPRVLRLGLAGATGGALGGALLLLTPASAFEKVVPFLIGGASLFILVPRRQPGAGLTGHSGHTGHSAWLTFAAGVIAIYAGYFGAAAGVLLLALLLTFTSDPLPRSGALKNVTLAAANALAAIGFAFFGPVDWAVALPLSLGCLAGGRLGPVLVRRIPTGPLRLVIALAGVGLAIKLGLKAYR